MALDDAVDRYRLLAAAKDTALRSGDGPLFVGVVKYAEGWKVITSYTLTTSGTSSTFYPSAIEALNAESKAIVDELRAWQVSKQQEINAISQQLAAVGKAAGL